MRPWLIPLALSAGVHRPPGGAVPWDWQIGASSPAAIVRPARVRLMDLDGFMATPRMVAELRRAGVYTVCYINAGSYQPGLPDSGRYPASLKLQADPDWPGEVFLDVSDVFRKDSVLAGLLLERLKMCRRKGFDAVEPDNLQNHENVRGGRVTLQQQLDFNGWIADQAHALGLAVFQKNGPDLSLLKDRTGRRMVEKFDGILNEQCQEYGECALLAEYTRRGKLALNVEYRPVPLDCALMRRYGIQAIRRDLGLVGKTMPGYVRVACS